MILRWFEVLRDDGQVAVVGVKDAEALVFSQTVKQLGNRFRIWHGVLQLTHAIGHVGVGVGHATEADVVHAGVVSDADLLMMSSGARQRDAFLRLDAELASSLVANTALVDFDLVRQRSGWGSLLRSGWSLTALLAAPLAPRPSTARLSCADVSTRLFEEVVQGGVGVLDGEEQVGPGLASNLLPPPTNRPATEQCGCAVGQVSDEGLRFLEGDGVPRRYSGTTAPAMQTAPRQSFRRFAMDSGSVLRAADSGQRSGIRNPAGMFQHATDVPNVKAVGRDAKGRSSSSYPSKTNQRGSNDSTMAQGAGVPPSILLRARASLALLAAFPSSRRAWSSRADFSTRLAARFPPRPPPCRLWPWRCRP